jgi:hypothetical protein
MDLLLQQMSRHLNGPVTQEARAGRTYRVGAQLIVRSSCQAVVRT